MHCATHLFFLAIFCIESCFATFQCRCTSNNPSCWPNANTWRTFNSSVNGRLISPTPSAAVCNGQTLDSTACTFARNQWGNASWRADLSGAMQNHNWENSSCSVSSAAPNCNQGSVPIYGVDALTPEHVQTTIRFASQHRLRLVIKNTGHDYLGRSTAFGSLLLWTHHMKSMALIPRFTMCDGGQFNNAARLGAGAQWGDVYRWLDEYNLTAIGGAAATVGAVGGFLQGGGHGPLSRWQGFAADQILEFDVIIANGTRLTVNQCQNSDLFYALSGGGGGTYGIVISAVLRTFPTPHMIGVGFQMDLPNDTRYRRLLSNFSQWLPSLHNGSWSCYFFISDLIFNGFMLWPNGDYNASVQAMNAFAAQNSDLNFSRTTIFETPSFYSFFEATIQYGNPTGSNVFLGSRLIPETVLKNDADRVADVFIQARGDSRTGSSLLGHLVAGSRASTVNNFNNSIIPGWRTAVLQMVVTQSWLDSTPSADQDYLKRDLTRRTQLLSTLSAGYAPSSYMNEADPNEENWQATFFGSWERYNRLKSIKNRYDPDGLFVCRQCVGSDDWTSDLNCPKSSGFSMFHALPIVFSVQFVLFL